MWLQDSHHRVFLSAFVMLSTSESLRPRHPLSDFAQNFDKNSWAVNFLGFPKKRDRIDEGGRFGSPCLLALLAVGGASRKRLQELPHSDPHHESILSSVWSGIPISWRWTGPGRSSRVRVFSQRERCEAHYNHINAVALAAFKARGLPKSSK